MIELSGIELRMLVDSMPPVRMERDELRAALIAAQTKYDEISRAGLTGNTTDGILLRSSVQLAYLELRSLQKHPEANEVMAEIIRETREV